MKGAKSYIVGKGAVCALGNSLSDIVANIELGESGVKETNKSSTPNTTSPTDPHTPVWSR